MNRHTCLAVAISLLMPPFAAAQTNSAASSAESAQVPHLIRFSGMARDEAGQPMTNVLGVTFALYRDEQGGAPLWIETQNVRPDGNGHYTVMLGADTPEGLPLEVFTSGEARWLEIRSQGLGTQPRVLLVSVPYAIKAHEAETLAGRSISDFVLNEANSASAGTSEHPTAASPPSSFSQSPNPAPPAGVTSFSGTNTTQIVSVTQKGTGDGLSATTTTHAAISGTITGPSNTAVYGLASNTSAGSSATGVTGVSNTQNGPGVQGVTSSATGFGVQGVVTSTTGGTAVQGLDNATSGFSVGVEGQTSSVTTNSAGVSGNELAATGQVYGVSGNTSSTTNFAAAVNGYEGATTGEVFGVQGGTASSTNFSAGVAGTANATTGQVYGISGVSNSTTNGAAAVNGYEPATTGAVYGVSGGTPSTSGTGVAGFASATTGVAFGVSGSANSTTNGASGINASEAGASGNTRGLTASVASTAGYAVYGDASASTGFTVGVFGDNHSTGGVGTLGKAQAAGGIAGEFVNTAGSGFILLGQSGSAFTTVFSVDTSGNGFLAGNLNVTGKLTKGSGSFKIDDPLDPAHKYLSHSFVESPDMMDVYNGNVTTDRRGLATVVLPKYFEALNGDFRYQLTVIGQFAQAIVAKKIANNRFVIRTSKPGVEVSWQVTGIRHDAYAEAYRIPVEEEKPPHEQGRYLHPELFGASDEQAIGASAQAARPIPADRSAERKIAK